MTCLNSLFATLPTAEFIVILFYYFNLLHQLNILPFKLSIFHLYNNILNDNQLIVLLRNCYKAQVLKLKYSNVKRL
jgi:hypothetical protein